MRRAELLFPPSFGAGIFDFDDTLALTYELWHRVDVAFLSSRGITYTPDVGRTLAMLGFEGGAQWCIQRYGLKDTPEEICEEWRQMGRALYTHEVRLRPGAENYLRALRDRGVPIALATTNELSLLEAMRRNVDVFSLFDVVVCGHDVASGKDKPDIYLEAARRLADEKGARGLAPSDFMVFEDLLAGIYSAQRAGMRTCAVLSGNPAQDGEALSRAADCAIADWREIPLE